MTFKKRGLGRGLEALLAEDSARGPGMGRSQDEERAAVVPGIDDRASVMVALLKEMQRERLVLLEEAEALRNAIEEFESLVRTDLRES